MTGRDHPVYGFLYAGPRMFPDGRIAYVHPLVFGRARLCVGSERWVDDAY